MSAQQPEYLDQFKNLVSQPFAPFNRLFDHPVSSWFYTRDVKGKFTHVSLSVKDLLGYEPEDFRNNWMNYLTDSPVNAPFREAVKTGKAHSSNQFTAEFKTAQGSSVLFNLMESPILSKSGRVSGFQGVALDFSHLKHLENTLRMREKRFREISQSSPIGIFQADADDLLTYVNPAFQTITGKTFKEILGHPWWEPLHPEDRDSVLKSWADAENRDQEFTSECRIVRPDGKTVWVHLRSRFLFDDTGKIIYGTLENINDRKAAQTQQEQLIEELLELKKKLEVSVRTDPLTGLPNRRGWAEKLHYEKVRFERYKRPFSIMVADVDNFKNINDKYGHGAGDFILIQLADLLKRNLRKQDVVCRWGGEEFIILLPETSLDNAVKLAEKLRFRVENRLFIYDEHKINVTLSFGVTEFNDIKMDVETCVKTADQALYKAKEQGRNRVVSIVYPDK